MLLKTITLGVYYHGNSFIHRLQARTKLLALFWLVATLIVANRRQWHFAPYIAILALLTIGIVLARISPREIWRRIWLLLLLLLLGSIPSLSIRGDDARVLYAVGPLPTSYATARSLLIGGSALLILLLLSSLLPFLREAWRKPWLKRSRVLIVLLLLIALITLTLLSGPAATTPLLIGPYLITYSGVWVLMTFFVALIVLYVCSLLLTMTTSPVALVEGLTMLLSPLRRLKLPVDDFALMCLIALRFMPTLLEEVEQLIKAQASRGADMTRGTIRERLQSLTMLFIPLMRGVLRRATELATALEARGYEVEGRQTFLHETALGLADYVVLGSLVLVTVSALLLF
jgi:energy-coupling factor transport system permease protein